jgi:ABC-2 type transport system permease protein
LRIHRSYNPEGLTRYNIVSGLIGTILTMTMVMLTSLAMMRERERGTMENLLATPVRPFEVIVGKITPNIISYVQLVVIILAEILLFEVPILGSVPLLMGVTGLFMLANLGVGFTFSTLADGTVFTRGRGYCPEALPSDAGLIPALSKTPDNSGLAHRFSQVVPP